MKSKKMAILGCGNGGHMMAAEMKLKGHEVRLYEMPSFRHQVEQLFETKTIEVSGLMKGTAKLDMVTDEIDKAIDGADYILITTPAFAHASYAELLKGRVKKNQVITVFPGAFAALLLRNAFGEKDCPVIADVDNLPYSVRLTGPCKVTLFGRNRVNIAFLPAVEGDRLVEEMRADLFPFEKVYNDVLECGLALVNPALHTGPCLLNISNIERPDINFFIYEHGFTASASKMDIALDNERKAVGSKFGYNLLSIEKFTGLQPGYTWQELYMAIHGSIELTPIVGPNSISNRYFTEDAPYGLVPWASIANQAGVPTPIIDSVINIYNIIHETDWRSLGNTVEKLGIAGMSVEQVSRYTKTGMKE